MKYTKQFLMILLFSFFGEFMKYLIPLPVPASIYGLILLFLALELHIIKLNTIRETGKFLIDIMPLMFIPAGAGLINSWSALKPVWIPIAVIMVVSTIAVMIVSGKVTQAMILKRDGRNDENEEKSAYQVSKTQKNEEEGEEDEYIFK